MPRQAGHRYADGLPHADPQVRERALAEHDVIGSRRRAAGQVDGGERSVGARSGGHPADRGAVDRQRSARVGSRPGGHLRVGGDAARRGRSGRAEYVIGDERVPGHPVQPRCREQVPEAGAEPERGAQPDDADGGGGDRGSHRYRGPSRTPLQCQPDPRRGRNRPHGTRDGEHPGRPVQVHPRHRARRARHSRRPDPSRPPGRPPRHADSGDQYAARPQQKGRPVRVDTRVRLRDPTQPDGEYRRDGDRHDHRQDRADAADQRRACQPGRRELAWHHAERPQRA